MKCYWDRKEQLTKQHPQSKIKQLVHHIGEVTSCYNRNETSVPVFYRGNKLLVLVLLAHSWFNSYAPELVPILYYCDKTRIQMIYFLNKG